LYKTFFYRIKWSQVFVHIVSESYITKELILDILNCCWVQLCKIDENNVKVLSDNSIGIRVIDVIDQNECYGCAIIRQIDFEEKCFYLITPETIETIEKINCIIRPHGVTIPSEILSEQFRYSSSSNVPYISIS
jgi:polynucleotide 5'-kinase involved in rRNA processing